MPDIAEGKVLGIWAESVVQGEEKGFNVFQMIPRICWRGLGLGRRIDPIVVLGACVSSGRVVV